MKKRLVIVMIVALVIVLTACGKEEITTAKGLGGDGLTEMILTENIEIETITIEDRFKEIEIKTI